MFRFSLTVLVLGLTGCRCVSLPEFVGLEPDGGCVVGYARCGSVCQLEGLCNPDASMATCDASCQGCCQNGICIAQLSLRACGQAARACRDCGIAADRCEGGACQCGAGAACSAGQRCLAGACVCDSTSCAEGCCSPEGRCVVAVSQTESVCGRGGGACAACNNPSPARCAGDQRLVDRVPGQCVSGQCQYESDGYRCANGCDGGLCIGDACQGCLDAPRPECIGGNALRSYRSPGTCSGLRCEYQAVEMACSFGCRAGACLPDPCQGLSCTSPEPSRCEGNSLRVFSSQGTCVMGACSYNSMLTECTAFPRATCMGNVRTYYDTASCSVGRCDYPARTMVCQFGCNPQTGQCMGDSCANVTCNMPDPAVCEGSNRRVFTATGATCSAGTCSYPSNVMACPTPPPDCVGTSRRVYSPSCAMGTCSSSSMVEGCNAVPAPVCMGSVLRTSAAACSNGQCSYPPTDVMCVNGCMMGTCVACQSGGACSSNPSRCRQGVLACPNGPNSAAVCVDGPPVADGADCGAFTATGPCQYGDACSSAGTRAGTIPTCAAGACTGRRMLSMADPACNRMTDGLDCGSDPFMCPPSRICRCELRINRTCSNQVCQETREEVECGLCPNGCP